MKEGSAYCVDIRLQEQEAVKHSLPLTSQWNMAHSCKLAVTIAFVARQCPACPGATAGADANAAVDANAGAWAGAGASVWAAAGWAASMAASSLSGKVFTYWSGAYRHNLGRQG